jgi:hypothetical protein
MLEPAIGADVILDIAINVPDCKKSANPFPVRTSAVAEAKPVPLFIKLGVAKTPLPVLTSVGASKILFGSVIVIVGAEVYPEPGSRILITNIFSCATNARALVVAPSSNELATVPAVPR